MRNILILLHLDTSLLNFNLEIDVLLEGSINLVWSKLGKSFLEEMDLELDIKVLLLKGVNMLK